MGANKKGGTLTARARKWLLAIIIVEAMVLLAAAMCSCTGTRTVQVPVEVERVSMRTDTLRLLTHTRDTVIDRDTVLIELRGDTILREVTRWRWRISESRDTLWQTKTDSVYVEKPVTITVAAPLTGWQRVKQNLGGYALALSAVLIVAALLWLRFRKSK